MIFKIDTFNVKILRYWKLQKCSTTLTFITVAITKFHNWNNISTFRLDSGHSVTQSCLTLCNSWMAASQGSLSITNSQTLFKFLSIELVMPSNHLILSHPHFLPPSIFPNIRVYSNKLVLCIRWPKYWSFSFSISLSNEYSGLISFRIDW